jgi:hypothetical protein
MDRAIEIYYRILFDYFRECCNGKAEKADPVKMNKEKFRIKALFVAAILYAKNKTIRNNNCLFEETLSWLDLTFSPKNLFSEIIRKANTNEKLIVQKNLTSAHEIADIDIAIIYESLLGVETGIDSNVFEITKNKNYRNKLGSYYTPKKFAENVTEKTINTFLEFNIGINNLSNRSREDIGPEDFDNLLNIIPTISFADLSSGGGIFLVEIINYFENFLCKFRVDPLKRSEIIKSIAFNIFAFDVDCLALEIGKLTLLLRSNIPHLYDRVSNNFVHANVLMHGNVKYDCNDSLNYFSRGYIYHEKLSLDISKQSKYDVIIGNPPWEKIRFEDKKFYSLYSSGISSNHFKASRIDEIIKKEFDNKYLSIFSAEYKEEIEKAKKELKKSEFFSLSNKGELNTYALFTEASIKLKSERGVIGLILKSAIATSQVNKNIFKHIVENKILITIYDFINTKKIFNIDSRERFCFLLLGKSTDNYFNVSMNLTNVSQIKESQSTIRLCPKDLQILNPTTGMLPNFASASEAKFILRVSKEFPYFDEVHNDAKFGRIVHLTNHAEYISKKKTKNNLPIYEGKFFNQYDGKFSGFNGVTDKMRYGNKSSSVMPSESEKNSNEYVPESRFFIDKKKWQELSKNYDASFMLAWRSLTSATNARTCISTILPFIPASQSVQLLTIKEHDLLYMNGLFNSVVFDYIVKKKLSGIDLTQSVIKQIPVPSEQNLSTQLCYNGIKITAKEYVSTLVYKLLSHDFRMQPLSRIFPTNFLELIPSESRPETVRRIDLLFFHLYRLTIPEIELVLSEFKKQYSNGDVSWFKEELLNLNLFNDPIGPTRSLITAHCPL